MAEAVVEPGKVVSLIYALRDQAGNLVEYRDIPVAYLHGAGSDLFPRIEQALAGRKVGDRVSITLPPEDGFGQPDPSLTYTDDLENVPPQFRHIGAEVEMRNERGESRIFTVTRIADGKLTADGNHPLAGQTVQFEVTITDIRDATEAELRDGVPHGPPGGGPVDFQ